MATFPHEPQDLDNGGDTRSTRANGAAFGRPPSGRGAVSHDPDADSSGEDRSGRKRPRPKGNSLALQGRFSGRLAEKADEVRLVTECSLLGPLLGESQPQTLSTLVRSIATGKVRKYLEDHLPAPGTEAQWHSQSAMAAAEEQERRIGALQQEVDSLKARLWDSAARIAELEKLCGAQQSQLNALTHLSPGDSPQTEAPANGNAIHAPQPVRFGHASTSGFARVPAAGSSLGPARNSLDAALSPGLSPALAGASTLDMARALGRNPSGTPGLSGTPGGLTGLSGLGTPSGMNSWPLNGVISDYSGAGFPDVSTQFGGITQDQLTAAMQRPPSGSRPDSASDVARAAAAGAFVSMARTKSQENRGPLTSLAQDDASGRGVNSPSAFTSVGPGAPPGSASLQEHLASLTAGTPSPGSAFGPTAFRDTRSQPDYFAPQPATQEPKSDGGVQQPGSTGNAGSEGGDKAAAGGAVGGQAGGGGAPLGTRRNSAGEDAAAAALVNLVSGSGGRGSRDREAEARTASRSGRPQRRTTKPRSGDDFEE